MLPKITDKQLQYKKRIGTCHGNPVMEMCTSGGLYIVAVRKNNAVEVMGTGPHRAVARFIAKKKEPTMLITELSKSDWIDRPSIDSVLAKYEALTDAINGSLVT